METESPFGTFTLASSTLLPHIPVGAETASRRSGRYVEEFAKLLHADLPPLDFCREYLRLVMVALKGVAGAVYAWTHDERWEIIAENQLTAIGHGSREEHFFTQIALLEEVKDRAEPLALPPQCGSDHFQVLNESEFGVLYAPILVDRAVAGVVEIWLNPADFHQATRFGSSFLAETTGFAAAYLYRFRFQQLQEDAQSDQKLKVFSDHAYAHLDLKKTARAIAEEGRGMIASDQLAVVQRKFTFAHVLAIGGAPVVDPRSPLVKALSEVCTQVALWGDPLVYSGGRDESLPPTVLASLDRYLRLSPSRVLVVYPLTIKPSTTKTPAQFLLVAERFDGEATPGPILRGLDRIATPARNALTNAWKYSRIPLIDAVATMVDSIQGAGWTRISLLVFVISLLASFLFAYPANLRVEAQGQLLPRERQFVFAPFLGKIVEMKARAGEDVAKGQEVLFVEDLETQLKLEQLGIQIRSAESQLTVLNDQIQKARTEEERNSLTRERIKQQYDLERAAAERGILERTSRTPQRTPLRAPLSGKVVTFDTREALLGKTVKAGDALLRIAQPAGPWELEMWVPEADVGQLRFGLQSHSTGAVDVDFFLTSHSSQVYHAKLVKEDLGWETQVRDGKVVLPIRVKVIDPALLPRLDSVPVGVEIRAKIHCGQRSLGYVWFRDLIEAYYQRLLF